MIAIPSFSRSIIFPGVNSGEGGNCSGVTVRFQASVTVIVLTCSIPADLRSDLIWVLAELSQQFRQMLRAAPFLFRRLLRLFGALTKLCFAQKRGLLHLSLLLGS
jgi:hypothetical protein